MKTVDREVVNQMLYEGQRIVCTKVEFEREVRDAMIDYSIRMKDLGLTEQYNRVVKNLQELENKFTTEQ